MSVLLTRDGSPSATPGPSRCLCVGLVCVSLRGCFCRRGLGRLLWRGFLLPLFDCCACAKDVEFLFGEQFLGQ